MGDLVKQDGNFYTFNEFSTIYEVRSNFLEYRSIITAAKSYLLKLNIQDLAKAQKYNLPIPHVLSIINKDKKGCHSIYKAMQPVGQYPNSLQKWTNEIADKTEPNFFQHKSIYDIIYKFTKDPKLIWFQYRINHRILATNYLLKKMKIINEDMCTFCQGEQETLTHLFFECEIITQFWTQLQSYIKDKCNLNFENWSLSDILFGNTNLDNALNLIILNAKFYIYYNKMKQTRPSLANFKHQLCVSYKIEKYISKRTFKFELFEKLWDKYINLTLAESW